jgi:hypothetical protein
VVEFLILNKFISFKVLIRRAIQGGITCLIPCVIAATSLAGCFWVKPDPTPQPEHRIEPDIVAVPEPEPDPGPGAQELQQAKIRALLVQAQQALSEDRLLVPREGSAFSMYWQVLDIDQTSTEAHWGMRKITERYLILAESAFIGGNHDRAELMLKRALRVSATPAEVKVLRAHYPPKPAPENEHRLSVADLTARNEQAVAELDGLAKKAQTIGSRLLIIARNDAEGRWMYQQMRTAVEGHRLRGNIQIGRIPAIVFIDVEA